MYQPTPLTTTTTDPSPGPVARHLGELCATVESLLQRLAEPSVIGEELAGMLAVSQGAYLDRLLAVCGHPGDAAGFFTALIDQLENRSSGDWRSVVINGVAMPHPLLLAVLEVLEPGEDLIDVTSVDQLEGLLRRPVPLTERAQLQEVLDRFPVRLSRHSLRQLRLSWAVARQYLPFVGELDQEGLVNTWVGHFHNGVIERMYWNRVIMVLNMGCPVYCRFCFRKHKECRQERPPSQADVLRGVEYIRSCPEVTEVVLTGGDPFLNRPTLTCALEGLLEVDHVQTLRIAARSLSYHPALFTERDRRWLRYLRETRVEAARRHKRIEIATHFIHPDELSIRSLDLIAELVGLGIPVYVQTPLLGGINDGGDELAELYRRLRSAGAEMHYVFMPCSPLQGNRAYRSTIDDGLRLAARLRGTLSDRAMPRFCTATAIGKIDWGINGWAVEEDSDDRRFLWIRTPYSDQTFAAFTDRLDLSGVARHSPEGTLDARFMVDVGDRRWLHGAAAAAGRPVSFPELPDWQAGLAELRGLQQEVQHLAPASPLQRVHQTRAELDCAHIGDRIEATRQELAGWRQVTDLVLWSSGRDPLHQPALLATVIDLLGSLPQLTAIRVRSQAALTAPHRLPAAAVQVLQSRNRLGTVAPLRVELELEVLHAGELGDEHGQLVEAMVTSGVSVYCTTLLLAGINLDPSVISTLTATCRRLGMELHHLVVAGDPAQERWNREQPIQIAQVIAIASELRRVASGRALPRFMVRTALGEADLGLTAEPVGETAHGCLRFRLLHLRVDDNGTVEPWGTLPAAVELDHAGHPILAVAGICP